MNDDIKYNIIVKCLRAKFIRDLFNFSVVI